MATVFLWANILIFGFLTESKRQAWKKRRRGLRELLFFGATWQLLAALIVFVFHANPWHLVWCLPLSFLIAFILYQKLTPASLIAAAEELDEVDRRDFLSFVDSQPTVRKLFADQIFSMSEILPQGHVRRLHISSQLCALSEAFGKAGDRFAALQSLRWSLKFEPFNVVAWMDFAELHLELSDRCAARWALKFLQYEPDASTPNLIMRSYEELDEPGSGYQLHDQRLRMREIISICAANPDWHDSAEWLLPFGL